PSATVIQTGTIDANNIFISAQNGTANTGAISVHGGLGSISVNSTSALTISNLNFVGSPLPGVTSGYYVENLGTGGVTVTQDLSTGGNEVIINSPSGPVQLPGGDCSVGASVDGTTSGMISITGDSITFAGGANLNANGSEGMAGGTITLAF